LISGAFTIKEKTWDMPTNTFKSIIAEIRNVNAGNFIPENVKFNVEVPVFQIITIPGH
jgi:hypothetical protein